MPEAVMTEKEVKEMHQALSELRKTVEAKDADTADSKAKVAKLEKSLDDLEKLNQKMNVEFLAEQKAAKEAKEQITDLEKRLARLPAGSKEAAQASAEMKAFERFAAKGMPALSAEEQKYLRTDSDTEGGYLAPPEYVLEIIKAITEVSPVRQVARVRRTSRGEIELPKRTGKPTAAFRGEGGTMSTSQSAYGMVKVPAHFLDAIVVATGAMLTDAAFNMETEINADVVESMNEVEGAKFLGGTLPIEPEGILTSALINAVVSGIANDITADNFYDLQGTLKVGYDASFMFNRRTLAKVRKMKGGDGHYLFAPATAGAPATIAGDPYVLANDMPDVGAGLVPILHGDFFKGYTVVDGMTMAMLRDPYTLADTGKVRFIFSKRTGGKVTLGEAISKLTCST